MVGLPSWKRLLSGHGMPAVAATPRALTAFPSQGQGKHGRTVTGVPWGSGVRAELWWVMHVEEFHFKDYIERVLLFYF